MPLRLLSCLPAFVLLFFIQKAECRLNDPFPNPVGNGSLFCYASVPSGKIDFELPGTGTSLRLKFDSDPRKEPGILGMFWRIPLLDSAFREIDRNVLEWTAPNETAYFFYKNSGSPDRLGCNVRRLASAGKYDVYLDSSGCWLAKKSLKGYEIVVEEIGNPDCFFQYKNFRLVKIGAGKPGAAYVLSYEKNLLKSVRLAKGMGAAALFEYDGGMLKSLRYGGKTFSFGYGEYSIGQSGGKPVKLLSEVACGGEKETYSYGRMGARERGVLLRGCGTGRAKGKSEVLRMTFTSAFGAKSWIEWCAETGMIMADSGGEYYTGNDMCDARHPEFKKNSGPKPSFVALQYMPEDREYPEIFHYDMDNLILTTGDSRTGGVFRHFKIASPGPAYWNNRKVEQLVGGSISGGGTWATKFLYHYDPFGRLIRKIDANGSITTYVYNAAGDLSQKLEDGMLTYFLGKEKREDGSTLYFYEKKPGGNVSRITEAAGEPGVLTEERVSADGRSGKIRYLMEENAVEVGGMKFYKKLKQEK